MRIVFKGYAGLTKTFLKGGVFRSRMKIPKTRRTYCKFCKKHTEHKVAEAKRKTVGSVHTMSRGGKIRAKLRDRMGMGSQGKYSKPPGGGKMKGKKQTKKIDLRFECKVCKKSHTQARGIRARKVEYAQ